ADFAPRRGKAIGVEAAGRLLELNLAEVQELPCSVRSGGAFRLEFHGPSQASLAQGVYRFHLGQEPHDIFIVPIGSGAGITRYEAIFF
ncbi:MAG: DUF6916 family protein, partial [Allosphingosinicella sp.]